MNRQIGPKHTPILLCTLNARYIHTAFGLRYLYAQMGELQASTEILEFTLNQDPREMAETILSHSPQIVGFGVYIWNTLETERLISILKSLQPDLIIVLGGPEVSHETQAQSITQWADHVIQGEGDLAFPRLVRTLLDQVSSPKIAPPRQRPIIHAPVLPDLHQLKLPYEHFTDQDLAHRVLYVEASRGCPFKCEYCLSSLDEKVRTFPLDSFLGALERLIHRGARTFKFVDRTFNLKVSTSTQILDFFLRHIDRGLFLHFEMVPDRLPEELRARIVQFPRGSLQFEIGIQTWNPDVATRISRRMDFAVAETNLRFIREQTGVHTHVDLIVGLPGETLQSFGEGFDRLVALDPGEIQIGILKRLRGTPITRHNNEWQMVYQPQSPYTVLSTKTLPYHEVQIMIRFAKYWDLIVNSGRFKATVPLLIHTFRQSHHSVFRGFYEFTQYLWVTLGARHSIPLAQLGQSIWDYLNPRILDDQLSLLQLSLLKDALSKDLLSESGRSIPPFLRNHSVPNKASSTPDSSTPIPVRQRRHLN